MQRFKKLIVVLLIVSIGLPQFGTFSVIAKEEGDIIQFFENIGVYSVEDGMLYENDTVLRENLAAILSVFYGLGKEVEPVDTIFQDVPANWASGHIMTVVNAGIMSGYSDGLFRPQAYVTVEQAIKILVTMTGYQVMAEHAGGFPTGYFTVAQKNGMLRNLKLEDPGANITKGELTQLLYNSLFVTLLKQTSAGEHNKFNSSKGDTLLSEALHIYEVSGKVSGLPYTQLEYEEGKGGNTVLLDDTLYLSGMDAYEYLGTQVTAYYKQTEEDTIGEILHIKALQNSDDIISIDAKDIISTTLDSVSFLENGKVRKTKLPTDITMIFNGKRMTYFTEKHLKPLQGKIKLIDGDGDNVYETVIVESYLNYHVKLVNDSEGLVYITEQSGKTPLKIDLNDTKVFCTISNRGLIVSHKEINENDIISVMADSIDLDTLEVNQDSCVFRILLSKQWMKGKIQEIREESVLIDDVEYNLAGDFDKTVYPLKIGAEQNYYLNVLGEISAIGEKSDGHQYGILQNVDMKKGLDKKLTLRIYTAEGKFADFTCVDKPDIDGYKKGTPDEIALYLKNSSAKFQETSGLAVPEGGYWQLIKYTATEEGVLSKLETILPNRVSSEDDLSFFGAHTSGILAWLGASGCLGGIYGVTRDTLFFGVGQDKSDTENYEIFSYDRLTSSDDAMYFFDAGDLNVVKVAIRSNSGPAQTIGLHEYRNMMIFERFAHKVNTAGEVAVFMCGTLIDSGQYAEAELSDASLKSSISVMPGDFVRWAQNSNGLVSKIEKAMSPDGSGNKSTAQLPGGSFNVETRVSYGTLLAFDNTYIKTRFNGTNVLEEPCLYNNLKFVYIYDKEKDKLLPATIKDLRSVQNYGEANADKIGAYYRSGSLRTIVIYR